MSNNLERMLEKRARELAGPSPFEQHIILLKFSELMDNAPDFSTKPNAGASPQRQWIAQVGALIRKVSPEKESPFAILITLFDMGGSHAIKQIQGIVLDIIEDLKLELELAGRADIGSAYAPGDRYRFFVDLKSIVSGAQSEIFLIDPYFGGEAFNNYLADVGSDIKVRIFANKHTQEIKPYTEKHQAQYNSNMEVKKSKRLHDRLIIIDRTDCWITGGSTYHAGTKKPTYLIPVSAEIGKAKLEIYEKIWDVSQVNGVRPLSSV
ncbi:MAG: hypothetical protein RPU60_03910 [Candidatus Sedimenticola sp. (ex Thyasira tokunagai)]